MKVPHWARFSRIGIREYIAVFCFTVFLAVLLLMAAACLPQSVIQQHVVDSINLVYQDMENNYLFDKSEASKMDVLTEITMLRTSLTTNDNYMGSILTNPVYVYDDLEEWDGAGKTLADLAYGKPADGVWFYTRYWMGFRVLLRLALMFFTYAQIKRYLAFLFFCLFAAVISNISKHANSRIAFLFALSIILVRPHVMATSLQLTCCFFIAFGAMLLIPWLKRNPKWEGLVFMEIGMITMYFDFYTVPLVTMGFPLLYLCVLKHEAGEPVFDKGLLRNIALWFAGYVLMWIAKLTLTTLLTSENALAFGFSSFFSRVGISKDAEMEAYYSWGAAAEGLHKAIFADETGAAVYLLGAGMILMTVLFQVVRGRASFGTLRTAAPYLLFAAIPLAWFMITKQPIALHYFFQYRTIALTHWASGVFLYYLLPAKKRELTKTK